MCFREFGDRVVHWTTVLEPNAMAQAGYDMGILPPNRCSYPFGSNCTAGNSSVEPYLFIHHSLLAHASAVRLYREKYKVGMHYNLNFSASSEYLLKISVCSKLFL